jgi:hypothetical protein
MNLERLADVYSDAVFFLIGFYCFARGLVDQLVCRYIIGSLVIAYKRERGVMNNLGE